MANTAEIIDAHYHLWNYSQEEYSWIGEDTPLLRRDFLFDDYKREMQMAGVQGSIVVEARQSLRETTWLLDLAEDNDIILGVVGWVPLDADELPRVLHELVGRKKLKGIRHWIQSEHDANFILRDDFNAGIACLTDADLVYDLLIDPSLLAEADTFVKRHPQQRFVLDHMAKPSIRSQAIHPWREDLRRFAENENVYCKLSGMVTEADRAAWSPADLEPYLDEALLAFGADRLIAGSDWPVCLLACSYACWWRTLQAWADGLGRENYNQIFGGTARKVYRL